MSSPDQVARLCAAWCLSASQSRKPSLTLHRPGLTAPYPVYHLLVAGSNALVTCRPHCRPAHQPPSVTILTGLVINYDNFVTLFQIQTVFIIIAFHVQRHSLSPVSIQAATRIARILAMSCWFMCAIPQLLSACTPVLWSRIRLLSYTVSSSPRAVLAHSVGASIAWSFYRSYAIAPRCQTILASHPRPRSFASVQLSRQLSQP